MNDVLDLGGKAVDVEYSDGSVQRGIVLLWGLGDVITFTRGGGRNVDVRVNDIARVRIIG